MKQHVLTGSGSQIGIIDDRSLFRFRNKEKHAEPLGAHLRARNTRWGSFALLVDNVVSTNELARDLVGNGAPHGSLVVAETQTAGRGRWNRRWESARGGLYMSVILRPVGGKDFVSRLSALPILSSVAAVEALEAVSDLTVQLRWPNDLYRDARKLGGILCESSLMGAAHDHAIVGFGINVNQTEGSFPAELASSATSMRCLLERSFDLLEVAAHVVSRLERWWDELETAAAIARFRELAEGLEGYPIQVRASNETSFGAKSLGISSDGGLRVELSDGTERILYSDDVVLLRPDDAVGTNFDAASASYYAAVETHFVERRGSPLFITPHEWQLVWEWEQEGIPVRVVTEGIDRVFERPKTGQKPRKLSYCRQTVEAAYRRFREVALGGVKVSVDEQAQDAKTHLTELAGRLRRAHIEWKERDETVAATIALCEREVEALAVRLTPESLVEIEAALTAEEQRLLDRLERSFGDDHRQALLRESEASLADYRPRMPEKVYASAVRSAYRRRLRLELGIPTLSLLDR